MKVYLSSTFIDLARHRATVGHALRKAGYEVMMMEEYVARDQRVEFACQGDVVECDIYAGIFAWRYGSIPNHNNPEGLSVTEMEYAAAGAKPMTRLTFLLDEKARWPEARKDSNSIRINYLRAQLKEQCSAYFTSADQLAVEVLAALRVHESTRLAQQMDATDVILDAQKLGPSYMMNIRDKLSLLIEATFVELHIAPTPWWNTRLYLVACIAQEFGRIQGFVFLDGEDRFLLMAAPSEICYRMELRWPALKQAYSIFRQSVATSGTIGDELWRYPLVFNEVSGTSEENVQHSLSARDLEYELGITRASEVVDVRGKSQHFLQREILGRQTHFVALVRDGRLEGLVDREILAQRVAQTALS